MYLSHKDETVLRMDVCRVLIYKFRKNYYEEIFKNEEEKEGIFHVLDPLTAIAFALMDFIYTSFHLKNALFINII